MRILLISYEYPPHTSTGGIATYSENIVKAWIANNFEVIVFSANPGGEQIKTEESDNYKHYLVPAKTEDDFRVAATKLFELIINRYRIDVIETPETGAAALDIKLLYPSIPLIVKLHTPAVLITRVSNTYLPVFNKLRFVAGSLLRGHFDLGYWSQTDPRKASDKEYIICKCADVIFSPSQALKKWSTTFWGLPDAKVKVVPNPFVLDQKYFNITADKKQKLICFIGKLSVLKGVYALTKAMKVILSKNREYRFVVVGREEPELIYNEKMLSFMKRELKPYLDRVEFTGPLDKNALHAIYERASVSVVPSLWENFPSVVLESMASLCCVVASRVGGIPEIVQHEHNGLLFSAKNHNQLVKMLQRTIDNEAERRRFAVNARNSISNMMNQESVHEKIIMPYKRFAGQRD